MKLKETNVTNQSTGIAWLCLLLQLHGINDAAFCAGLKSANYQFAVMTKSQPCTHNLLYLSPRNYWYEDHAVILDYLIEDKLPLGHGMGWQSKCLGMSYRYTSDTHL